MRHAPIFVLGLLLFCLSAAVPVRAQICSGDITLSTQAEVDDFNCSEVTGNLTVGGFGSGSDITDLSALSDLTAIGGGLYIYSNYALESLAALGDLGSIGGDLWIGYNYALTSLAGLEAISSISGDLRIENNDTLPSLSPLTGLISVVGELYVGGNDALTSLAGLEDLTFVDHLFVEDNDVLLSLSPLSGLTSIGGNLYLFGNASLVSLSGLESVTSIGDDLWVGDNEELSTCSCGLSGLISGDPPTFSGVVGTVMISDNNPQGTCISPEVVLATPCQSVANEEASTAPKEFELKAYPNPVTGPLTVRYALPEAGPVRLSVYDLLGREVAVLVDGVQAVGRHEARLGGLAAGVYVVRMEAGEEARARRVTVLR